MRIVEFVIHGTDTVSVIRYHMWDFEKRKISSPSGGVFQAVYEIVKEVKGVAGCDDRSLAL